MSPASYDLIVVGGGINGAGIAADAARRGLSTLLLEQYDFGSGTTSWSSRLIHGGLRYLEYAELSLVYESLRDRRSLLVNAPHLVRPLRIAIPIYSGARRGPLIVRLGMIAYDLLSLGKALPSHEMLGVDEVVRLMPGIATEGLRAAAVYYDAQVAFAERLVVENVLDARSHGADTRNYCKVERIDHAGARVTGVRYRDTLAGTTVSAAAPVVVNAGGPWVDRVLGGVPDAAFRPYMGGTKGSHIVLPRFPGLADAAIYVESPRDGRPVFIIPWNGQALVGTTDIRFDGDPHDARATPEEIDYLLDVVDHVFPDAGIGRGDVRYTYSGVRPLPRQEEGPESAITRRHTIRHHNHVARGLYSVIGGKLTTYRSLADDLLARISGDFDLKLPPASTRTAALPGGVGWQAAAERLAASLPDATAQTRAHLSEVYGARALEVATLAGESPALHEVVCAFTGAIAAEVLFALREEQARTLDDVLNRRTMIGLGPDRGIAALAAVARLMGEELGWSDRQREREVSAYRRDVAERFGVALPASEPARAREA